MRSYLAALLLVGACAGSQDSAPAAGAKALPQGFHAVNPMLVVDDVDGAVAWYVKAFGATEIFKMAGADGKKTMHAEVRVGDSSIMLEPEMPEHGQKAPKSAGGTNGGLNIYVENVDAAVARATDAGATVLMPAADMFWGDRFAELQDPYGHRWTFATHIEDVTPEVMGQRGQAAMAAMGKGEQMPAFEKVTPAKAWLPEGWRTVSPFITVDGAAKAIDYFVQVLGAKEVMRMPGPDGKLMHAELIIGDSRVMLTDQMQAMGDMMPPKNPQALGATPVSLMLYVPNVDEVFAAAVKAGGKAAMEPADMFWGDRFGQLIDPFGNSWGIATHMEDPTPEQMQERMKAQAGSN